MTNWSGADQPISLLKLERRRSSSVGWAVRADLSPFRSNEMEPDVAPYALKPATIFGASPRLALDYTDHHFFFTVKR